MKRSNTEQEVLKEAESQGVSLTKKQSSAIAELVDADLEASGGAMSKKARIGMYVGIGLGVAALGTGAGLLIRHAKGRSGKGQDSTPAPTATPAPSPASSGVTGVMPAELAIPIATLGDPSVPAAQPVRAVPDPAAPMVPAAQQPPAPIPDGMSTFRS